jgi:hypothetical protein
VRCPREQIGFGEFRRVRAPGVPEELREDLAGVACRLGVGVAGGELRDDFGEVSLVFVEEDDVCGGLPVG